MLYDDLAKVEVLVRTYLIPFVQLWMERLLRDYGCACHVYRNYPN